MGNEAYQSQHTGKDIDDGILMIKNHEGRITQNETQLKNHEERIIGNEGDITTIKNRTTTNEESIVSIDKRVVDLENVEIVDVLSSTSTTSALSANQGKVLNDKIEELNEIINANSQIIDLTENTNIGHFNSIMGSGILDSYCGASGDNGEQIYKIIYREYDVYGDFDLNDGYDCWCNKTAKLIVQNSTYDCYDRTHQTLIDESTGKTYRRWGGYYIYDRGGDPCYEEVEGGIWARVINDTGKLFGGEWFDTSVEIINKLTSTSATSALSAKQGKVLNEKIEELPIKSLEGETVKVKQDTTVTADVGATIIGDLRERTFGEIPNVGERATSGNIASGEYALASGKNTTASGVTAFSGGLGTIASGRHAVSMGCYTEASGEFAVALGYGTKATNEASFAMGNEAEANGKMAVSFGRSAKAKGKGSFAAGLRATANGDYATSIGQDSKANNNNAISLGMNTNSSGSQAISIGNGASSLGQNSVSIGTGSATNTVSISIGRNTTSSNYASLAMGNETIASGSGSTSMGEKTTASATCATAMGRNTVASARCTLAVGDGVKTGKINSSDGQLVSGRFNDVDATDNKAVVVGNGSSDTARANAYTLDWSGNGWFAGTVTVGSDKKEIATKEYVKEYVDAAIGLALEGDY